MAQIDGVDAILDAHLPAAELKEVKRILYGRELPAIPITAAAAELASRHNFEIKAFQVDAAAEQLRKPRVVRIGLVQNSTVLPTTAPFAEVCEHVHGFLIATARR